MTIFWFLVVATVVLVAVTAGVVAAEQRAGKGGDE